MKKIYIFFLLTIIVFGKAYSQSCISLGCAASHTGLTTDGTLPDSLVSTDLGCYNGNTLKQIFWQYFYSPSGGDYTQTFTPTSGTDLSLNYVIFDEGTTAPSSITCPVSTSGWTQAACDINDHPNQPSGPGLFGVTLTTVAGHYYAIAIVNWQGMNGANPGYNFDISTPQIGGVDVTPANCPGVLPVILSSFNAKVNNCTVNLDWTAEAQSGFKNYEVQYSSDGLKFQTIATITGNVTNQKYTYENASSLHGTNYYRLKMTDQDGKFVFSKIISANLSCNGSVMMVYPNPVTNILNIVIPALQNDVTIGKLYNANGKLIFSGEMINGANTINMEKFSKGIYLLKLKNKTETQNIKIIK